MCLKYVNICTCSRKKIIALQQTSQESSVFRVNLRFVQNRIQTIYPVHFTKFGMQQNRLCHEVYPGSSHHCLNLPFICHRMTIWSCIFWGSCASIFREKLCKMHFALGSFHSFKKKIGCIGVLSGEHTVHVVVAGLDKVTISMLCYLAMSRSPAIPNTRRFLTLYVNEMANKMPSIISVMKNVKTCWLSYISITATPTVPEYISRQI